MGKQETKPGSLQGPIRRYVERDLGAGTGSLARAGFVGIETFSFDVQVPYSHEAWVGRIRASAPVAGTLDDEGVRACSQELATMLAERYPENQLSIPHRVWAVTAQAPPS